jgi:hypothetical protein
MQTVRLNDPDNDATDQKQALMFLLHFIGDIHQPLHTEALERGGNGIHVCFDHRCAFPANNLHEVWDKAILMKRVGIKENAHADVQKVAAQKWAEALHNQNQALGLTTSRECSDITTAEECALRWATESNQWNCKYVLKDLPSDDLGDAYYEGAVPIVDELIGKAGLRLGAWINALAAARSSQGGLFEQRPGLL